MKKDPSVEETTTMFQPFRQYQRDSQYNWASGNTGDSWAFGSGLGVSISEVTINIYIQQIIKKKTVSPFPTGEKQNKSVENERTKDCLTIRQVSRHYSRKRRHRPQNVRNR